MSDPHPRTARTPRRRAVTGAAVVAATIVGAACAPTNQPDGLLGVAGGGCPDLGPAPADAGASAPSAPLTGLDRRAWPTITVEAPANQVEHQPTYFEPLPLASGPARNTGAAPTTATVLQGPSDGGSLLLEAGVAPFVFAGELVIFPVRMIVQPPWTTVRGPAALPHGPADGEPANAWRWVEPAP